MYYNQSKTNIMTTIYISNSSLDKIVENFDTKLIDFGGDLRQEFELESVFTNSWQNGEVDVKVIVDLIVTNNTTKIEKIRFDEFIGFIAGSSENVNVDFDESYLEKLEESIKYGLNC